MRRLPWLVGIPRKARRQLTPSSAGWSGVHRFAPTGYREAAGLIESGIPALTAGSAWDDLK